MLGRGEARGMPDLTRTDLAEAKMRREPRGAVAVGPVAITGIAGNAAVEERLEPCLRRRLARLPGVAQPPAQSGLAGSSFQSSSPSLARLARPLNRFGAGSGFGGSPSACTRRQNGVNTRRPVLLVADLVGRRQQVAGKAMRDDTDLPAPQRA